jgi:hypothetical protein
MQDPGSNYEPGSDQSRCGVFFSFVLEQRLNREEDSITGARFALDCEPGSRCT